MAIFNLPSATATSGTAIRKIIPGVANSITRINNLIYTSGSTAHTISILRPVATTTADTTTASGGTIINVTSAVTMKAPNSITPELITAGDYLAWVDSTGKFQFDTVFGVASNALTMTATLSISAGQTIWIFGELARATHLTFSPPVSATTVMPLAAQGGIPGQLDSNSRAGVGDPLIVYSTNVTAAGTIVSVSGEYITDTSNITMT